MSLSQIFSDVQVAGTLSATKLSIPAGTVNDAAIAAGSSGNYIQASKLSHKHQKVFAQDNGTTVATARQVVHVVEGATATIQQFRCGASVANIGAATYTVDLKKNGSTILTATITVDNSYAAFATKAAAGFTSTALVVGDVLEIHITAAAAGGGTLAKGFFAQVMLYEDPA